MTQRVAHLHNRHHHAAEQPCLMPTHVKLWKRKEHTHTSEWLDHITLTMHWGDFELTKSWWGTQVVHGFICVIKTLLSL